MMSLLKYVKTTISRIKALIKKHPYLTASLLSLAVLLIGFALTRGKPKVKLQAKKLSDFMEAINSNLVKQIISKSITHLEYMTKDGKFLIDGSLIPKSELFRLILQKKIKYTDLKTRGKNERIDVIIGLFCFLVSMGFSLYLIRKSADQSYKFNDQNQVHVKFDSIYGLQKPKQILQETIEYLSDSEKFQQIGCRLRRGIIFYGPPGTGKTMLAKAMATESHSKFISSSASEFCEMYVGVGPKRVRKLFSDAKKYKSAIIFIDEIDALGKKEDRQSDKQRNNTLNELLVQMDGFISNSRVVVIAATNKLQMIEPALLRSGRFDLKIQIPLPNQQERKGILEIHLSHKSADISQALIDRIASRSSGMCGADLESLTNQAAYKALRRQKKQIQESDLQEAFQQAFRNPTKRR